MNIKAICFDVVGTMVDWRKSISLLSNDEIAHSYVMYYAKGEIKSNQQLINKGKELLQKYNLPASEAFINVWTYLKPWPDVINGLKKLKEKYIIATLTNLSTQTITELSNNVGLSWNFIMSAETVGVKKPDPRVYQMAVKELGLKPEEILMVAAHTFDLEAAQREGFYTCYIERGDDMPKYGFNFIVNNLQELEEKLNDY